MPKKQTCFLEEFSITPWAPSFQENLITKWKPQIQRQTGRFIDYSKMAKKAFISRHACLRYSEILDELLIYT